MIRTSDIDAALEHMFGNISFTSEPTGLYDPLRYMIDIGGKRIRPRLCLLSYALFKDRLDEEVFEPAAGLEVFHSFTLIHDDIMDRSPLRRGKQTVWRKWNEDTAILSGDVMLIDAYRRMSSAPEHCRSKVMTLFSTTAAQVCEGQQYDMEFESRDDIGMDAYNMMIGLKTAVLIACSAKMGALLAGASEEECDALYRFGYQIGMAFQVADDYLDAYGDEKVFGKPIGGDIINGKKSWLTVRAYEASPEPESFVRAFTAAAETEEARKAKFESVKSIYDKLGVAADALAEIEKYHLSAKEALCGIDVGAERLSLLYDFATSLFGRVR